MGMNKQSLFKVGKLYNWHMSFNPLTPKTDRHLFCPYKITLDSNIKVVRIKEMINN